MPVEKSVTDTAPEPEVTPVVEAPAFDLDAWIGGMSATERSVDIYGNTAVFGRYEALTRELSILEAAQKAGEASVEDGERAGRIHAEMEDLYRLQQDSKTTWYVQACDSTVLEAIGKQFPVPDALPKPAEPSKNSPEAVKGQHATAVKAWEKKNTVVEAKRRVAIDERNLHIIASALVRITNVHGVTVATSVTVDQLRVLQAKPHGAVQTGALLTAALQAKAQEPVIPAPFSPGTSRTDRA